MVCVYSWKTHLSLSIDFQQQMQRGLTIGYAWVVGGEHCHILLCIYGIYSAPLLLMLSI